MILSSKSSEYKIIQYYSLRSLVILFRDLQEISISVSHLIIPNFIKFFFRFTHQFVREEVFGIKSYKQCHFKDSLYELEETYYWDKVNYGLVSIISEFISTICNNDIIGIDSSKSLFAITWHLAHFLLSTQEDEYLWFSNPDQYISENENELNFFSYKESVLDTINNLIEKFDNIMLEFLTSIIFNFIDVSDPKDSWVKERFKKLDKTFKNFNISLKKLNPKPEKMFDKNMNFIWKKREASLLLLGQFIKDIIGHTHLNQILTENHLVTKIYNFLESENNQMIKGRALWTLASMKNLYQLENETFIHIYCIVAKFLDSTYPSCIRFCASKALTVLSYKIAKEKI